MWTRVRGDTKVGISWSADHRVVRDAELILFVECWIGVYRLEAPGTLAMEGV